jgi:hypothetical protein
METATMRTHPPDDRATIDEALFGDQTGFFPSATPELPPEIALSTVGPAAPPLPPFVSAPADQVVEVPPWLRFAPATEPVDTQPCGAVRDGGAEYQMTGLAPGLFELRVVPPPSPRGEGNSPPPRGADTTPLAFVDPEPYEPEVAYFEPPSIPCVLAVNGGIRLGCGEEAVITPSELCIRGPEQTERIEILLLAPPTHGALLRDGFALAGGDTFTQQDIDAGRVRYRHDGSDSTEDRFTFATPDGEVQPALFVLAIEQSPQAAEGPSVIFPEEDTDPGETNGDCHEASGIDSRVPGAGLFASPVNGTHRGFEESGPATPWPRSEPAEPPIESLPVPSLPAREAPLLFGPGDLSTILDGCLVADLLAGQAQCQGPDQPAGLAVVNVAGRGQWYYSLDGMQTWLDLGEARAGKARLLGPDDGLRFVPREGWSGTIKISYRAWDQSTGQPGEVVDLAPRVATGGATAFSAATASAVLHLAPAAPADTANPWEGEPTLAELVGDALAVVRLEGEGSWQYSLDDGRTWRPFGVVYHGRARLLRASDRVRFLPRRGAGGKVLLGGRPWDGRGGSPGGSVSLAARSSYGDGTPFGEFVQTRTWWMR